MSRALLIKQAMFNALATGMTTLPASSIYNCRETPFSRDEIPALNIKLGDDSQSLETMDAVQHELDIEFDIHVRGEAPDELAEPIRAEVLKIVFADPAVRGLCLYLRPSKTKREFSDADQTAGVTTETVTAIFRLPIGEA